MVFYETMQERVARILAELDICAEPCLRYVAAASWQIPFSVRLLQTPFMREI